jgi:hypothetical protein
MLFSASGRMEQTVQIRLMWRLRRNINRIETFFLRCRSMEMTVLSFVVAALPPQRTKKCSFPPCRRRKKAVVVATA